MPDVMIATRTRELRVDGRRYRLRRGRTTAHSTHPAVLAYPDAWMPLPVDLRAPGAEPGNAPAEEGLASGGVLPDRGAPRRRCRPGSDDTPDLAERAAAIRAWAAEQGIDVSPRGKIPAAVVKQYEAAHREVRR